MRGVTIWRKLLGVEQLQVLDMEWEGAAGQQVLVVSVRPSKGARSRCSRCRRRRPGYDQGGGTRRWRSLDWGSTMVFLQAAAPRVNCRTHGVVVAAVPWARPGARATRAFEDQCAWLAAHTASSVVAQLMRTSWRHVSAIIEHVVADGLAGRDVLAGLQRIGIDEISHRKGHRYLTCVVDQDSGRLVWAAPGRNSDTLHRFFDELGPDRAAALTHVSADGAQWIHDTVTVRAPQAVLGLDPFHVVGWATRELDNVRRQTWNMLRGNSSSAQASSVKGSRWALLKNPADLSPEQRGSLASIAKTNRNLYRAYLLKEQLRAVFQVKGQGGRELLAGWIAWASRSQLPGFIALAATLKRFQQLIWNTLIHQMSNAQSEATNTHLRALTRRSYGFHSPEALIAMAMLTRGGLCPPLPGR
ncbi:ISL3 family transposase [Nakamurella sp. PAMC28650]|uniref:ISL3 family transposase n=1 Tax=Nakamurella sp. PAMC28650 TaxID=2762325 RepID=UPI00164E301B|nr:ISL3 family transposase [Nakamurella sp. PAMC28650]QNK79704.1 ISL3 family transposase [Nakamurella sp. PAMC28650]